MPNCVYDAVCRVSHGRWKDEGSSRNSCKNMQGCWREYALDSSYEVVLYNKAGEMKSTHNFVSFGLDLRVITLCAKLAQYIEYKENAVNGLLGLVHPWDSPVSWLSERFSSVKFVSWPREYGMTPKIICPGKMEWDGGLNNHRTFAPE